MFRARKGRRNGPKRSTAASAAALVIPHPPPLVPALCAGRVVRFIASAAVNAVIISATNLQDLFFMATAANAGYRTVSALRLRKVELWAPPGTTVPASCSIRYAGTSGNQAARMDQSIGASEPAHVVSRPPPGDLAFWLTSTTALTTMFIVSGPAGLIVDVHLSVSSSDTAAAVAVTRAVAGATLGTLYVSPLDSAGGSLLVPQGVNTI